jgi:hypothetical protein
MCNYIFNFRIFPAWDRTNLGVLFIALITFITILAFSLTLSNFFIFFGDLKKQMQNSNIQEKQIDSTLSKIIVFNIFKDSNLSEKYKNPNIEERDEKQINFPFLLNKTLNNRMRKVLSENIENNINSTIIIRNNTNYTLKNIQQASTTMRTKQDVNSTLWDNPELQMKVNNNTMNITKKDFFENKTNLIFIEITKLMTPFFVLAIIFLIKVSTSYYIISSFYSILNLLFQNYL